MRACLGYATTLDEVRAAVTIQAFSDGQMLTTNADNSSEVLPVYAKYGFTSAATGFYLSFLRR
jgi:hypothetical protein